jgi:PAS domain S-box-containing protein
MFQQALTIVSNYENSVFFTTQLQRIGVFPTIKEYYWQNITENFPSQNDSTPDLVLVFVYPDVVNRAITMIELLSKKFPTASIIVVSNTIIKESVRGIISAGAQDYISTEQFDANTLEKVLLFAKERQTLRSRFKKVANDYKQLFDANPMPMWVYNKQTDQFIKVNEAACIKYGYSLREFHQLKYQDLLQKNTSVHHSLSSGYESHKTKDGSTIYVEITAHETSYKGTDAILALAHDITPRILAENERKRTSEQLLAIFENATDAILLSDEKGNFLDANQAAAGLFEYSIPEITHFSVNHFIHNSNTHRLERFWDILTQIGRFRGKINVNSKHSQNKIVEWRAVANIREGIHLHILSDITESELKAREDELNSMILGSIKDSFSLKQTLTAIGNNIRMFTGWQLTEFWMPDPKKKQLFLASSSVEQKAADLVYFVENSKAHVRKFDSQGLPIMSWQKQQSIWFNDLTHNSHFNRAKLLDTTKIYTAITVPILENPNASNVLGVLVLLDNNDIPEDNHLITVLSNVAASLGSLILKVKAREELSNLFNYSADLICITDKDGYFVKANPAFTRVLGYSFEELQACNYTHFIHQDDLEESLEQVQKLYRGEIVYAHSNRYRTANNDYRHIEWVAVPDPNGKQVFVIGRDVTELKSKTEEALKHAEAVKNTLESITDGFFTVDKNWIVTYWNSSAEKIFQQSRDSILGKSLWVYFSQEATPVFYQKLHEVLQQNASQSFEAYFQAFDLWIEASVYPSTEGLSIYFKDTTMSKKQAIALQNAQQNQEAIINSTTDIIWSVNRDFNLILANKPYLNAMSNYLGEPFQINQASFEDRLPKHLVDKWKGYYQKGILGESFSVLERLESFAEPKSVIINFNPIYDHEGNITGVACFSKDITDLNQKIEIIAKQSNQLEEIAWFQSHQLRAPVSRILGIIEYFDLVEIPADDLLSQVIQDLKISVLELDSIIKKIVNKTYKP